LILLEVSHPKMLDKESDGCPALARHLPYSSFKLAQLPARSAICPIV